MNQKTTIASDGADLLDRALPHIVRSSLIFLLLLPLYNQTVPVCKAETKAKVQKIDPMQRQALENANLRRQLAIKELENVGLVHRELVRQICERAAIPLKTCQIDTQSWTVADTAKPVENGPKEVQADEEKPEKDQ